MNTLFSHVLQDVPDDLKAMRELFRILKLGGWSKLDILIIAAYHAEELKRMPLDVPITEVIFLGVKPMVDSNG